MFNRGAKQYGGEKIVFQQVMLEQLDIHMKKKNLHDPGNHDGLITHLEPDILECEVKWALESITTNKASGGDGIPGWAISNP